MNHQISELNKVCLLGVSSLTAAFAIALRNAGYKGELYGVDDEAAVSEAVSLGYLTAGSQSLSEGLANSDLNVLGESVSLPDDVLAFAVDQAMPYTVMLDMVVNRLRMDRAIAVSSRRDLRFIGFHVEPALGSGDVGWINKAAFAGKTVLLTPQQRMDQPACDMLKDVFEQAGGHVHVMNQEQYDERHAQFDLVSDVLRFLELETILRNCRPQQVVDQHLEGRIAQELDYCSDSRKSEWMVELSENRAAVIKVLSTIEETVANLRTNILIGSLDEHVASVISSGRALLSKATQNSEPTLVVSTGDDPRTMQMIALAMAEARVAIDRIEKLADRGAGFFKLRLQTIDQRTRAIDVLRTAGIHTEITD